MRIQWRSLQGAVALAIARTRGEFTVADIVAMLDPYPKRASVQYLLARHPEVERLRHGVYRRRRR